MQIGYGQADITPAAGLDLTGYGSYYKRPAKTVLAPLLARAILIRQASGSALLISCDLLGLTASQVAAVKDKLHKELGLAEEAIMIACTHTHSGPVTGNLTGSGQPDPAYLAALPERLVSAAKAAALDLADSNQVKSLVASIEPIGYNRALAGGPVDKKVKAIIFERAKAKPVVIINHACHPVTLGPTTAVAPDFPGATLAVLAEHGYAGLFLNGFCGDLDPVSNQIEWASGTAATVAEYGQRLAAAVLENLTRGQVMKDRKMDVFALECELALQEYDEAKIAATVARYRNENNQNAVDPWAEKQKQRLRDLAEPYQEIITVPVLRLGSLVLVGFPGEPFFELGDILAEALPGYTVLAVSNSNESLRYIATKEDIAKDAYGGLTSSFVYGVLPLEAGAGEKLARNTGQKIRRRLENISWEH